MSANKFEVLDYDANAELKGFTLKKKRIESLKDALNVCNNKILGIRESICTEYNNKEKKKLIHYTLPNEYKRQESIIRELKELRAEI